MRPIFNDHSDKANGDIFEKMDSRIKITTTLDGLMDHIRSFGFVSEDPIVLWDSNESTNNDTDMEEFSSDQPVSQAEMTSSLEDSQTSVSDKTLSEDKDDEMHMDTTGDFVISRMKLQHKNYKTNEKHSRQIHLHQDDIFKIRCDAIVNAANCSLKNESGIDKQIQDRDRLAMKKELE